LWKKAIVDYVGRNKVNVRAQMSGSSSASIGTLRRWIPSIARGPKWAHRQPDESEPKLDGPNPGIERNE
jgi:hypothetical protein